MSEAPKISEPRISLFWARRLGVELGDYPAVQPLRLLCPGRSAQDVYDIWHSIEDGVEDRPECEWPRRLRRMRRLELTMLLLQIAESR